MRCDNVWFAAASSILCCLFVPDFGKLYLFKFMFPFFWAGYLAAQNPGWRQKIAGSKWIPGVAVAGAIASWFFWNENAYVYVSMMTFSHDNAGVILFRFAAGVLASGAALWIFHQAFLRWRGHQPVTWLGTRSLYIFVLQSYFFSAIGQFTHRAAAPPHFSGVLSFTAAPVLALILAVAFGLASRWIEKSPLLALLFFGKQLRKAA